MDDCVAATTVAVEAYRRRKQRIKNISQLALVLGLLDEEVAIVPREHVCNLRNVPCTAGTSSVQILYCWEVTYNILFAWHVSAFELHSCGCASPKRSKTTGCTTPRL